MIPTGPASPLMRVQPILSDAPAVAATRGALKVERGRHCGSALVTERKANPHFYAPPIGDGHDR